MSKSPKKYKVSLLQAMVLLHNLLTCDDGDNDAYKTRDDLIKDLNRRGVFLSKESLESLLYCSNMNSEDGKFWHPTRMKFNKFVSYLLPAKHNFHFIYNFIVKDDSKKNT